MNQQTEGNAANSVQPTHRSWPSFDGWDVEFTQLSAGTYAWEAQEVQLDGVQIYTAAANRTTNQFGAAWPNSLVFAIPCRIEHEGRINGQRWCYDIAAFRGETEFNSLLSPIKLLTVAISRDVAADYLQTVEHASLHDWLKRGMLLINDPARAALAIQAFTGLLEGSRTEPSLLAYPQARAAARQTAMEILAPLMLDNLVPPPAAYREFSHTQLVRRAREFALANIDQPLQIIDVCRALGVSRRALQYGFQDVLNINPVAYLRLLRLNGAHRDLANAGDKPVQVQDVIARWGFWHFSRFSAEYKKMYKELPSETLRHALAG